MNNENKVLSPFKDKFTKKVYRKGDSYSHADEKRIAFLVEGGFLEGKPQRKAAPKKSAKETAKKAEK